MANRTFQLECQELDLELWRKTYYKYQKEYQRQRLLAIKYLYEGKTRSEVSELLNCTYKTLSNWIDKFLQGGLDELVKPITHQVKSRLSEEQKQELKRMLLEEKPTDYGIDKQIWTGEVMSVVIKSRWDVELKTTRIYEILKELNLTYQKASNEGQEKVLNSTKNWKVKGKRKKCN
jgi:transposase